MPQDKDPIVYRYSGSEGESLTGLPARSLRQSDVDALDADQKRLLKDHVEAEHLPRHVYKAVEESAPEKAAKEAAPEPPASQSKTGAAAPKSAGGEQK